MNNILHTLLEDLEARCWTPVAPLKVTAWKTREPVPFAQRTSGERIELNPGDVWGKDIFDCAWFHFEGTVPDSLPETGSLALRIDANGELLLTDRNGKPLRGLTSRLSRFALQFGSPRKTIFQGLEKIFVPGSTPQKVECWADAGFNDLFGSKSGDGSLARAEIVQMNEPVRSLYYDIEVLLDATEHLPEQQPERITIEKALTTVRKSLQNFCHSEIESARRILAPFFTGAAHTGMQLSAVGHAHLDLAWLWPVRETIRKGARTFATALYLIERYPDYVFAASQPQLFDWMKKFYPELYQRIKEAVAAGRIEVQGAAWVECDMNITGGESIIRQLLFGRRFFGEEFGIVPDYLWLPDVFGYNGQLPQILKKSGTDYFFTQKLSWNLINRFPYHSFRWKGIDGSTVLAHMLPEDTYSSPAAPRSLLKIQNQYAERAASKYALLAFGIGDGGGGPGAEHLERLARVKNMACLPETRMESTAAFIRKWEKDSEKFPEWQGELYLERHQGTLTTQAKTKQNNRLAETALRELEWISLAAEERCGIAYPAQELDRIWKEILLYQFHDVLPGSSIERVYTESNARYKTLLAEIETLTTERCAALAAGPSAFNSLPWARSEWVKRDHTWIYVESPAMGWASIPAMAQPPVSEELNATITLLENSKLRVLFAPDGTIRSIHNKETGEEISAGPMNRLVVYEDRGDAWDIPLDYRRQPPELFTLISSTVLIDGPCAMVIQSYCYGKSTLAQRILLKAGSPLLEFETVVNWNEQKRMLRAEFPVAVTARDATYEIQFGTINRPTHDETSWDKAKEEVAAQQWCDLSGNDGGVSLINDCKYGHRIKENVIELNLLRSAPYPDMALIEAADKSQKDSQCKCGDQGTHRFRYAVYPHKGGSVEARTMNKAREFNQPLRFTGTPDGNCERSVSLFEIAHPQIDLTTLKKAEDGRGFIARLCNMADSPCETKVFTTLSFNQLYETNLMEEGGTEIPPFLHFAPFEIKTLRFV